MSTPGSNLLLDALSIIESTPVMYYAFASTITNAGGVDVTTYAAGVEIDVGSVQGIPRELYGRLGLDFEKRSIEWLVPSLNVIDWARDTSGDVIEVFGRRWQLKGAEDWWDVDGWKSIIGVDIGPATGNLTNG